MSDPALTPQQRSLLEFPESWFSLPEHPEIAANTIDPNPNMRRLHPLATAAGGSALREGWCGPRGAPVGALRL